MKNGLLIVFCAISWIITMWAVVVCVSVSGAVEGAQFESQHQYQAYNRDAKEPGDRLLHEETSTWITVVIPAGAGLIGAVLGGWITYLSAEKIRKRKTIYDIADFFSKCAMEWAEKEYRSANVDFMKWHNDMVDSLSPHVYYLQRRHKKICDKIWSHWVFFHGGDAGKEITYASYWPVTDDASQGRRKVGKDEWSYALYSIADILRES